MSDIITYIKTLNQLQRFDDYVTIDALEQVEATPIPADLMRTMREISEPNLCFNNTFHAMSFFPDPRYVVGYAAGVFPVEHAWVESEGNVYDPTWELFSDAPGSAYVALFRLTYDEVWDILERPPNRGCPPALMDVFWSRRDSDRESR